MDNEYRTEESIVAFIDILNSREMIRTDANKSLNTVHTVYEQSEEIVKFYSAYLPLQVSIFSDNIVISCKVVNESSWAACFWAVNIMAAAIQYNFLIQNILVRGGVSFGSFYKDDLMTWGEGLVKAYELESGVAVFPRIVIDPDLSYKLQIDKTDLNESKYWLMKDSDNLLYVDYLNEQLDNHVHVAVNHEIHRFDQLLEDKSIKDTRIKQKIFWHINYIWSKVEKGG